ncbi:MAG: hypothetical protein ABH824_00735 [Nanoarchaeota archaeon]|nr:hypothetical protein [Nanoarchaeota archaeon]MBU1631661.1 hypothetical protein [Nanoarchaeota archaeon]MBU1875631.1 hypothetical protein [Nanoarchaeota archaeon]
MALYEKNWWKKLFGKKERKNKVDVLKDIDAIIEFLNDLSNDTKFLLKEFKKIEELEKEYHVAKSDIIHINLDTQGKFLDKILERYESFQNDVDINGLRVKSIGNEFLQRAEKAGMKDLVKEKKKDRKWMFKW